MATWKKLIVSGSDAAFNSVSASVGIQVGSNQQITTSQSTTFLTGSFTGSFKGDGSLLTGIVASNPNSLTSGEGIAAFSYNGLTAETVAISGAAALTPNVLTKYTGDAFVNSSLTDDGTNVSGASSIQLTGANSKLTGSFSGSFFGDGSNLSGVASSLIVSSSDNGTNTVVNLATEALKFAGTANEVDVTVNSGTDTVTIGLPTNVTIAGDLTVNGDLSYLNVTNLYVEDKFVLLNSGSVGASDGGIVIAQSGNLGKGLVYDSGVNRWGFTGSLAGDATTVAPDAFVATVIDKNVVDSDNVEYQKVGNIRVETNGDIYIYS